MRAALWVLALFGIAVAIALFAGNNQGIVTVFWPPYRIDLSLNLVVLGLVAGFLLVHGVLRALSALFALPERALRWRTLQRERAMHGAMLDAVVHLLSGRFTRARKSALDAVDQEASLAGGSERVQHAAMVRSLAHLVAAESAQALQDRPARDEHLRQATDAAAASDLQAAREGALLRAARWSLDDRDPQAAVGWLNSLPHGAARRTLALRIKLKAARQAGELAQALETARLLAKHRAFSPAAAQVLVRGLAADLLSSARDSAQLIRSWQALESGERRMPELAVHAATRLTAVGGSAALAREWLTPAWETQAELGMPVRIRLVQAIEAGLDSLDAAWLARIESAHQAQPRDALLQYLAGMACQRRQLWGKAQQLLAQAAAGLEDAGLKRRAWVALADLAEQRGDDAARAKAWQEAATL